MIMCCHSIGDHYTIVTVNSIIVCFGRSVARATVRMRHRSEPLTTEPEGKGGGGLEDTGNTVIPLASKKGRGLLKRRKSIRPMAGRKNKEGREKAIEDHREVWTPSTLGTYQSVLGISGMNLRLFKVA